MGQILHFQAAGGKFFHAEREEGGVIGLEMELAAGADHTAVFIQEASVGQAALQSIVRPISPLASRDPRTLSMSPDTCIEQL